ncbi:hypothetical protein WISP_74969 [Willisornis vidua]|uniref:Ig-like domain-containing protein n=1 Tax=Willisornis vidua TaxID=1566151 RepID=A0ABQ9D740_9PASS|nr:hypothetical protein WISP_74969 [Willisornis vidua]
MQDDSLETSTSISQLLRESYLAETKHQGKSERSRSEPVSHNFHYGNASGDSDEVAAQDDLPDLSAFLSQEELDESVNLARQAIDHNPLETKQDELQARSQHPPDQLNNPGKHKQMAQSTALKTSDNGLHSSFCQDHIRNTKGSKGTSQDPKKHHLPSESESKKEFLNKAADFIEELSSLFKAHNSERIRPRTCKNYRSKIDSKNKSAQKGSSGLSLTSENRERLSIPAPQDLENKAEKTFEQTDDQQGANLESINPLTSAELKTESESASVYSDEPIGQPPRFTQKLKSREVPEGTKVQLDCIVVGIPAPEVRWYCEGKELENSPDIQIIQTGDQHSLIIVEAFEEDTGRYSCFASNIYGTDSTSAEIYIEGISSSDSEGETITDAMDHKAKPADTAANAASPAVRAAAKHQETSRAPSAVPQPVSVPVHTVPTPANQTQSPTNYLQGLDGRPIIAAPVFTKMLQDISASEGQLVVFECRVKGAPSPKVEWYREGTLIEDSPDFRILQKKPRSMAEPEEICTLVIAEVFSEDSGTFTCTAKNKYGTVSSIAHLTVKAPEDSGSAATLTRTGSIEFVAAEHQPAPQAPSHHAGNQTPKPKLEGVLVNHNEPRSSSKIGLRVHFKLPEDDKGSESSSEGGPGATNQIRPNHFPEKINGQPVKIPEPASPSKEPPPVLAKPKLPTQGLTKKNLKPLPLATGDAIRENKAALVKDLERKLHFREDATQQSSQQEYRISSFEQRLMNEIEFRLERTPVDESDDEVQHEEIPTGKYIAPIFDKRLKHFRVMEGSPVIFTCKIVGIPVPKLLVNLHDALTYIFLVTVPLESKCQVPGVGCLSLQVYWFKDGKQISKKNKHFKMSREEDGTCSLHIEAATNDDDGNYTIMAANPQVSGLPTPDLTWLLNGKPVLPDGTHKMLVRETGVHSLLIDPLSQNDAGTYTCLATNKTGQNSFSLELTVVAKEVQRAPMFLEKLQNCGVPEGYPVRLECRVVGMPPPIFYWKKDNETIPSNRERMSMHQDTTGYVCLLIQPAKKADAGWYTLSAKNEAGIVSCTARLDIYAQWHRQIPQAVKLRPGGSRYANLTSQGLDIFSAFPAPEGPALFPSPTQKLVESEEL